MALSKAATAAQSNTRKTRGTDDVLNICISDGIAPTDIDGWIHACKLTAKSMAKYGGAPDAGLDMAQLVRLCRRFAPAAASMFSS